MRFSPAQAANSGKCLPVSEIPSLEIWRFRKLILSLRPEISRRGARVVEEARLESVYTPKGYHEFESRSLRVFFVFVVRIFK